MSPDSILRPAKRHFLPRASSSVQLESVEDDHVPVFW